MNRRLELSGNKAEMQEARRDAMTDPVTKYEANKRFPTFFDKVIDLLAKVLGTDSGVMKRRLRKILLKESDRRREGRRLAAVEA